MKLSLKNFRLFSSKNNFNQIKNLKYANKSFSTINFEQEIEEELGINYKRNPEKKTEVYLWISNVFPGKKKEDFSNKLYFKNSPRKMDFLPNENPLKIYTGIRHHAIVTDTGNLYTFGAGSRGVLGHGNSLDISLHKPRLVSYFSENKIKIQKISLGEYHTLALTDDGDLYSWGWGGKLYSFFSFFKGKNLFLKNKKNMVASDIMN